MSGVAMYLLLRRDIDATEMDGAIRLETREIATVLGVNPDAAAQRLHRARERLAKEVPDRTSRNGRRAVR